METLGSKGSSYTVKPLSKALRVLVCLGEQDHGMSLVEISRRTGLPKTTTFKYLYTFRASGFVSHDLKTQTYRLGMRLWELGRSVEKDLEIRNLAMPFMRELRDCFDETINLGILEDEEIIYVGMVESKRSLRMRAELGGRDPAYSTSLGKAMLAFLPGERWREHVPSQLKPRTRRTHTSLQTLKEDLKMTRKRGFAVDHGENEEGARCVGAPVFDREGVVAAISLSAPESRLEDSHEQEVAAAVRRVAAKISERLAGATVGDDERHTNKSSRR